MVQTIEKQFDAVLATERYLPWVVAIVCAALSIAIPGVDKIQIEKDMANSVVTVVAIFIAFVATSMTVSLAESNVPGMKRVKSDPIAFRYYIDYHVACVFVGMASCILSFVAIYLARCPMNFLHQLFFVAWVFTVAASFTLFLRVVVFLRRVLVFFTLN